MVKSVLTRTVPVRQARAMQSNAPQGYYAASAGPASAAVSLRGDAKADVCIIGAGYTGLSAALHLATAGANVIVIEAESIGFGASGRNGGQIHPGHRKSQAELEHWLGVGHARDLWKLSEEARNLVFELASQDCELKRGLVIAVHNERAARELTQDTEYLSSHYGYTESRMLDRMQVQAAVGTDLYPAARMDGGGGHVHPLKYARKLAARAVAAGATIYVRSPALRIDRQTQLVVHGSQFKVVTDHIVLACDAFSTRLAPELSPYIAHVESFIVATEPLDPDHAAHIIPSDAAVADTRHVLDYYRKSSDRRLLFAGREAYWTPPDDVAGIVRPRMLKVFPSLQNVANRVRLERYCRHHADTDAALWDAEPPPLFRARLFRARRGTCHTWRKGARGKSARERGPFRNVGSRAGSEISRRSAVAKANGHGRAVVPEARRRFLNDNQIL